MKKFIILFSILFLAVLGYTGADRTIQTQKLEVSEPAASGTNKITLTSPAIGSDYTFTLPTTAGTSGYILATDGSGALSWTNSLTSPTFITSLFSPMVIGGTGTTSTLTLKTTTGVGTTNADMIFKVGNNGATEAARILNSGFVGIGTSSPGSKLTVKNDSDTPFRIERDSSATGTVSSLRIYNGNTTANNWTGMSFRGLDSGATEGAFGFIGSQMVSHTAGAIKGDLAFYTGSGNFSIDERMRIDSTGLVNISGLTASRAMVTDASKNLATSSVTSTELGYVSGVTSAIQTQLNAKAPSASPTFTGTITTPLTASRAVATGASSELAASATTATELGYVSGVTSAIQTQLNAKVGTMGAVGASPNANGASISGSTLTLQPASASFPGVITTGTQTIAGDKTLSGATTLSGNATLSGNVTLTPTVNSSLTGANQRIPSHTTANLVFTDPALTSIGSANNGGVSGGHLLTITNATGGNLTIVNNYGGAAAGETILTGTGNNVVVPTGTSFALQYNGTSSLWSFIGAHSTPNVSAPSGTLPIANGGTGQTTANNALNALLPSQGGNSGKILGTDGTNTSWVSNSTSLAMGAGLTGSTVGSVLFVGAGATLDQDNSSFFYDKTNKRLGLKTASPDSILTVNANTATPQAAFTNVGAHFAAADASSFHLLIDGYGTGSNPTVTGRRSAGTAAAPTAAAANAQILNLSGRTFGTTAYQGENASIRLMTSEAQTDTALGTYITMHTTANGGSTLTERMRIDNAGKVGIGRTPTTNTLEVNASASVNGTTGVSLNLAGGTGTNYIYYDDNLSFNKNGTGNAFAVDANRNITFSNIHNNGTPPTNTTQTISSGTYTPTLTNSTNVAASSNANAIWSRVGNVVTVYGSLEIDPTSATTNTLIGISLPIASNFVSGTDAFGMATMAPSNVDPADGWMTADTTNDRMTLQMWPNVTTNQEWRFHFQYVVK